VSVIPRNASNPGAADDISQSTSKEERGSIQQVDDTGSNQEESPFLNTGIID